MVLKSFDILITIIALIIILLFALETLGINKNSSFVKIEVEGVEYRYPLDKEITEYIEGNLGETTIEIKDGRAGITKSPCKNQTCIKMGLISKVGQSSACLPNRIILTIDGEKDDDIDALSY